MTKRARIAAPAAALLLLAVPGCGTRDGTPGTGTTSSAGNAPGMAEASAAAPAPAGSGPTSCVATGRWALCHVMKSLERAGLAPRRDSGDVAMPPLAMRGTRFHLGTADMEVFLYENAAVRARDEAKLDRARFIEASQEPTLRGEATLIRNDNLLAVLHSRNEHQRERVSDALTAGPPQPAAPAAPVRVTP